MTALTAESLRRLSELGTRPHLYGPGVTSVSKSEYPRSFVASIDLDEKDDWDVSSKASTEVVIFDRPAPTRRPIRRALTDVGDSDDEQRMTGLRRRASDSVVPTPGTLEKASANSEPRNGLLRARLDVGRAELRLKQEVRETMRSQRSHTSGHVPSSTKAASVCGGEESAHTRSGSLHYKPQKPTYLQRKPNRGGSMASPPSSSPVTSYSAYNPSKSSSTKGKPESGKHQSRSPQFSLHGAPMRDDKGDESDDDRLSTYSSATFSHAPRHANPAPRKGIQSSRMNELLEHNTRRFSSAAAAATRSSSPDLVELTTSGSLHGSSVPPSPIDPEAMFPSVSPALASPSSRRSSTRGRCLSRLYGSRRSSRTGISSRPRAAWSPLTSPSTSSATFSMAREEKSSWSRSRSPSPGAGAYVEHPTSRRSFLDRTLDRAESRVSMEINKHLVRAGYRPLSSFEVKRVSKSPIEEIATWQTKSLPPPPATPSERLDRSVPTASGAHVGGQQEPPMQDRKKLVSPYRANLERAANDKPYRGPAKKASDELPRISHQLRSSAVFEPSWATAPSNVAAPSSPLPPPSKPLRRGVSPDLIIDTKFTESPITMPVDAADSNFGNGEPPPTVKTLRRARKDSLFLGNDLSMKLAQDSFFPGSQPIAPVAAPVSTNSNAAPAPAVARPQSQFQLQIDPYMPHVSYLEGPVEFGSVRTDNESILPNRPLDLAPLSPPDGEASARDDRDALPSQIPRPSQRSMLTRKAGNRSLR
ncbi:hypothetical protein DL764_004750 [Monosporascus ibericus]|uniref:Uncharacterized protein n=1 Tax=Monosporascus ibericus TaxID=155417 RepID=A0A4V1XAU6_9PEZI|nr:hypothetical protein DL764_004750 [Monosporascus ibericus]